MCPEFTGSPERGWSQVVVRVSSLPHRHTEEKKHLLHHREGNSSAPRQLPLNRERRCDKALNIPLTWWRRPCRPRRHRKTSVQVRCPAREAPPWSGLKSYFISFPLHGVSRELNDHRQGRRCLQGLRWSTYIRAPQTCWHRKHREKALSWRRRKAGIKFIVFTVDYIETAFITLTITLN